MSDIELMSKAQFIVQSSITTMGIDIYARWKGQNREEVEAQMSVWLSVTSGSAGYLREGYHGEPYATKFLCAEAFTEPDGAHIPADVLRSRLPHALTLTEQRERTIYRTTDETVIEAVKRSYRDFVALCEAKEKESGEPVLIVASC